MRYVFTAWASPLLFFWGWYFLSLNDINFGTIYLTRELHDIVFQLCGMMLKIDPGEIPWMIAEACIIDTLLVLAIWAFRRRRELYAWSTERYERYFAVGALPALADARPDEPNA